MVLKQTEDLETTENQLFIVWLDYLKREEGVPYAVALAKIGYKGYKLRDVRADKSSATQEDLAALAAAFPVLENKALEAGIPIPGGQPLSGQDRDRIAELKAELEQLRRENEEIRNLAAQIISGKLTKEEITRLKAEAEAKMKALDDLLRQASNMGMDL